MQVKTVTLGDWQEFVESLPQYPFFQLPMWSQAFEKAYSNYKSVTQLYIFDDGVKVLVPLVEIKTTYGYKIYESLPYGGYGGLLWNKKPNDGQIKQITDHLLTKKTLLSIYQNPLGDEDTLLDVNPRFVRKESFTHLLTVSEPEDVFKHIKKYCRNRIRHAEKVGVVVSSGGINDLDVYYQIYGESAKRWGLPKREMYPLTLLQQLVDLGKGKVELLLAEKEEETMAGIILLHGKRESFLMHSSFKFAYSSHAPVNLLYWRAIQSTHMRGNRVLNFGGSEGLPGVQKFKETFGAQKRTVYHYSYSNPLYRVYKGVNRVLTPWSWFRR